MFATKKDVNMQTQVCPTCGSKFDYPVQFCDKCGSNLEKIKAINEQKVNSVPSNSSKVSVKYQGYVQIISALEIAFGSFGIVAGLIMSIMAPFMKDIMNTTPDQTMNYSAGLYQFFSILVLFFGVLVLLFSSFSIYSGYKLYRLENIGRFGTMIIASFALLAIPFGTVFGIISLILLNQPETINLFNARNKYI